jgi:predicted site-specific integrase-resolvase
VRDVSTYNARQFADKIGVSIKTLQRWDREGKLKPSRTVGNRRLYTDEHLQAIRGKTAKPHKVVAYLRVSSQAQKPDLKNQRKVLEQFAVARGLAVTHWVEEIGGGLNFKRPKFLHLVDWIVEDQVATLILAHKDRLVRFGFDLLEHLCRAHQCELLVVNLETLSPEQEMVQDLMTIVHCFSSRLYGLRNYRKALKKALQNDQSP